jgi:hypothetical protein
MRSSNAPKCSPETGEASIPTPSRFNAEPLGRDRRCFDAEPQSVQCTEQITHDPVRRRFGVSPGGNLLEELGGLLLGHQHVGVVGRQAIG